MVIIPVVASTAGLFCLYMLARNQWVFYKRTQYSNHVYRYNMDNLRNLSLIDIHANYNHVLVDYNTMMFRFWVWNMDKFVVDRERYNRVMAWCAL